MLGHFATRTHCVSAYFSREFARGFSLAAPSFTWSVGFVEMLTSMRGAGGGPLGSGRRDAWQLWCGRLAMMSMAVLALHADATNGLLHDFLENEGELRGSTAAYVKPGAAPEPGSLKPLDREVNVAFAASLASDVVLQDIPIDLDR